MSEPRRRILIVVDGRYPSTGGAEMQARLLARSFAGAGCGVRVIAPMLEPDKQRLDEVDGVPLERIPYPKVRLLGALVLCLRFGRALIANRGRYDAVHVHMARNLAAVAGLLKPWFRASLTVKISGAWEFDNGILDVRRRDRPLNRLYNALIRRADSIQCVSEYTRSRVLEAGYYPGQVRLIPNAVDIGRFRPRLARTDVSPIVVFVGRLVPVKGLPVLLEAWRRMPQGGKARLVIAGDGPERQRLVELAATLGIADTVTFLGEVADVPEVLSRASIYVQPSHVEGLSNSVLEAMASGLPIVATRISGNEDLITNGINGILVPPADPDELSRALSRLLANPDEAGLMGIASRSAIERNYATPVVMQRLLEVYGLQNGRCHGH